jgi:hypothetical protein
MLEIIVLSIKQCMKESKEIVVQSVAQKNSKITKVKYIDDILKRFSLEKKICLRRKSEVARKPLKMKVFENCFIQKGKRVKTFVKFLS